MINTVEEQQEKIKYIHGGREFFDLLDRLIRSAEYSIHLQTYIFNNDETGTKVAQALMESARRGVSVYLLIDGYASQSLPDEFIASMQEAGIQFRFFEPLFKNRTLYLGRRLHHKVFVADEKLAMVCGLNIADRYNDLPNAKAWLDAAILVRGKVAKELAEVCEDLFFKRKKQSKRKRPALTDGNVRILRNDWVMSNHEISKSYLKLFNNAESSITILCSYFLPGTILRRALKRASGRGVRVKVILTGKSDVVIAKHAERYLYRWMLRHGIEIFEYQPSVLHAKMGMADNSILTIGSYNVNDLSALASVELNIEVNDKDFVHPVSIEIENIIINDCCEVHEEAIHVLSLKHLIQFLSFYILRAILKIFTFYFHKR